MKIVIEGTKDECVAALERLGRNPPILTLDALTAHFQEAATASVYGATVSFHPTPETKFIEIPLAPPDPAAPLVETKLPCPHSRPSWQMCPHCNGTNEAARTGYPAAELVYLPTSTSAPAVGAGPSTNVIEGACPHLYVTAKGTCRACCAQVSRT